MTTTTNTAPPHVLGRVSQILDHDFWLSLSSHPELAAHASFLERVGLVVFPTMIEENFIIPAEFAPISSVLEIDVVALLSFCAFDGEEGGDQLYEPGAVCIEAIKRYISKQTFPNLKLVRWITEEIELPVWPL